MLVLFSFYQRKIYSENFKKGCNCFEGAIFVLYDDYSHFFCLWTLQYYFSKHFSEIYDIVHCNQYMVKLQF